MSAPGPTLYDFALDLGGYAVRLAASLVGKPILIEDVDLVPGNAHLSDPILELNPAGTLPIFTDGDLILADPGSIIVHLCEGTAFAASHREGLDRAMAAATLLSLVSQTRHRLLFDQSRPTDDTALGLVRSLVEDRLRDFEDRLSFLTLRGHNFLLGSAPSAADLIAFPAFAQSRDLRIEPEGYPAMRLWARRIRALPGFIGMPGIPDYH